MEWINYHHLHYFWAVARAGSITRACAELRLRQPTISAQLRLFEKVLGRPLFERRARRLVLTEFGTVAYRYADQIFALGREMMDVIKERSAAHQMQLTVGIVDVVPKIIAHKLLTPALKLNEPVALTVREDTTERLLAELAIHALDLVLTDTPIPSGLNIRAYHHLLGESRITLYGTKRLAKLLRNRFPKSLDGAPLLLPTQGSLRRAFDQWFDEREIRPRIVGEFEDSALLRIFGEAGEGAFPAPTVLAREMTRQYRAFPIGEISGIFERFYAISPVRQIKHPAVAAIVASARRNLFSQR